MHLKSTLAALVAMLAATAALAATPHRHPHPEQPPHRHDTATLELAVDGTVVTLGLAMPLASLVGFERAPRTVVERERAKAALARLRDAAALFRFDPAAQCTPASTTVEAPVLEQPGAGAQDGHADLEARYVFSCAQPAGLKTLEVMLFDTVEGLGRIEVEMALPGGQGKTLLQRPARAVSLVR